MIRKDAAAEVYLADAPTDDERYDVPLSDTVSTRPLWISPQSNRWWDILYARSWARRTRSWPTSPRSR